VSTPRTCIGYGEFEGRCDRTAGSSHSKLWCQRCDDLRLETLDRQFAEIGAYAQRRFEEGKMDA
jgi:hypothetical protein